MKTHLNTLFVTQEGTYLHRDGAAVEVRQEGKPRLRVPLHNLDGICCFAWDCTASAALLAACAEADVTVSFHTPSGKFQAATRGFTSGNILLRRAQYRASEDESLSLAIARNMVAAKIANARQVILRVVRDHGSRDEEKAARLSAAAEQLTHRVRFAQAADNLDSLRGVEGDAATFYFGAFSDLLTNNEFVLDARQRRPPIDPVNALLSFCYTLLMHDCRSALEGCGLDPQCGFLHRDRPGRQSLALDLMEELRAPIADRVALTLLNRRQLGHKDFETRENGGVYLKPDGRKTVFAAWQERKQTEILHPLLDERISYGLLPHIQARLLARHLRGDLDGYPAFLTR
ncbi:type I-C CRISPR-associated endonuclease Cas1 [Ruficoccus amylovorans]|uniref:CRISPR-associated endonuclease Cas1 n=1 Tax=Ruficoccus amylovorans TaxID=1804625 RepID=A0A842HHX3_9BACT|nr:type I-C CRISPR-associated endonuclease Cas1c [Ruficoccus amylovorans]MBC2595164.1 type I-C CRISPR-associated endonuclease Cas1 [Ruficoccus amylovorans]